MLVYPSDRHKNKLVRVWRTLSNYNSHDMKNVKRVYIFNDSSIRVQKILNRIQRDRLILIEEGVAPYIQPFYKKNISHKVFCHLLPPYHSCSIGFSGIYDFYMVVYPDLVINELKSKKIIKIDKDNYYYKSKIKINDDETLLLTSPIYNNIGKIGFNYYKKQLHRILDFLLSENRKVYLKLHPLEELELYQETISAYKNKTEIIPNFLPTNAINFADHSKIISMSFSSALLYTNNQKYIYKIPEDRFPYEEHKKIINRCGIKILDFR
jgi:hypothetical protein